MKLSNFFKVESQEHADQKRVRYKEYILCNPIHMKYYEPNLFPMKAKFIYGDRN